MSILAFRRIGRKNIFWLALALVAFYVLLPQAKSFKGSFNSLLTADFAWVYIALVFSIATIFVAALVYKFIALKPLVYSRTALIETAGGFTNRLLPAGAGAVALSIRYLTKNRHTPLEATAITVLNNLIGIAGNLLLLLVVLALPFSASTKINLHFRPSTPLIIVAIVVLVILLIFARRATSWRTIKKTSGIIFRYFRRRPANLAMAFFASMVITACFSAALYAVAMAFNVHLSAAQALIVATAGIALATITPTPGGLGGAEAALVAALIAMDVSSPQAFAVALTYRFVTFWLPILPGFICFEIALRRGYI